MTSKNVLIILSVGLTLVSAAFWWTVETALTSNVFVAVAYTTINVIGLPLLLASFIPDTAVSMLLYRVRWKTTGQVVALISLIVMFLHTAWMMWAWWAAQPVAEGNGLVLYQVGVGLVAVFIQALVIQPTISGNAIEELKQAHLVKRYELQAQADIAIMRSTLHRALELTKKRMPTIEEREELSGIMYGLTNSIDRSLKEVSDTVSAVTGIQIDVPLLLDNPDIAGPMEHIADEIEQVTQQTIRFKVPGRANVYTQPVVRWETKGAIIRNNSGSEVMIAHNWIIR